MTDPDSLLARLPPDAAEPLREALARRAAGGVPAATPAFPADRYPGLVVTMAPAAPTGVDELVARAMRAVDYPAVGPALPRCETLTEAQRAVATLLAALPGVGVHRWAIPTSAWARRRWLGLDPGGVLEREVTTTVDGTEVRAPLWRALALLHAAPDGRPARDALWRQLPVADRLEAHGELSLGAYRVSPPPWDDLDAIGTAGAAWAARFADHLLARFAPDAPHGERGDHRRIPDELRWPLFTALVDGGVALEPRWDELLPVGAGPQLERTRRLVMALPPVRRGPAVVAALARHFDGPALQIALALLPQVPEPALVTHVLRIAGDAHGSLLVPPRRTILARLREAVAGQPALEAQVDEAIAAAPVLPGLRLRRAFRPASGHDLTPGQRRQLAAVAQGWCGDEPVVTSPPDADDPRFGDLTFVSVFEIDDGDGQPAFDAFLWLDEDGAVAHHGTMRAAAWLSQMRLECDDPVLAEALHAILRERPPPRDA